MERQNNKSSNTTEGKRKTVIRPAFYAELSDVEDWLELKAQQGVIPQKLILGCIWLFKTGEAPAWDRYWYTDIRAASQGLFGQEKLTGLLPKLKTVFEAERIGTALTRKLPYSLTVKPNPNYGLDRFAEEEHKYHYEGARLVRHMTPDRMLRLIKQKRSEALLTRCRTAFISWLLAFVLICCLLVWLAGFGWHLLLMLPIWAVMLHYLISFVRLSAQVKKTEDKK